jgi:dTDP-4-dehydrorhamnose reductase
MKPILITGAGGLLGANLMADYAGLGVPVSGVDRSACDLTDAAGTTRVVREIEPSCIIHTAALTDVDWCESHPEETWRCNVDASRTLAQIARRIGAGMVYISTDSVFDGARGYYGEADEPRPLSVYARSKLAGERAVLAEAPDAAIVRTVIYGWNLLRPKRSLAEWILSRLTAGSEVVGFDDAVFSPILVNDLGCLLLTLLERRVSGVCHVAAGEACTKFEFARAVAKTFGFDPAQVQRASLRSAAMVAPRPLNTSLDTSYASRLLGTALPGVWAGLARFRSAAKEEYACV